MLNRQEWLSLCHMSFALFTGKTANDRDFGIDSPLCLLMRSSHRTKPRPDGVEDHGMGAADDDVHRGRVGEHRQSPLDDFVPRRQLRQVQTREYGPGSKSTDCRALQAPKAPSAHAVFVRTRPQRGISTQLGSLFMSLEDHVFSAK